MTWWVITDTHFGHSKMIDYCNRPEDFSERILKAWKNNVNEYDTIIHLGDVMWPAYYDTIRDLPGVKYLVKGNHDKKSDHWYEMHGFDFVCTSFSKKIEGIDIIFTHIPLEYHEHDINVCGHLHGNAHNGEQNWKDPVLSLSLEKHGYGPISMSEVLKMCRGVMKPWTLLKTTVQKYP